MESKGFCCLFCGHPLVWGSDASANEVSFDYSEDDTAVVHFYTCSHCGRSYEIMEPSEEERKTEYNDYWQE